MHHPKVQWGHTGPTCWPQRSEHGSEKDGMDGAYVNLGMSTAEVTAPRVQENLEYSKGRGGAVILFFSNLEEKMSVFFLGKARQILQSQGS